MEELIICPFTSKPLRQLTDAEIDSFHKRIEAGSLFFQRGVPLEFLPEKAWISQSQVYIYLEIDGVLLLQQQAAIVAKNRTLEPYKRTLEADIEAFYQKLNLHPDGQWIKKNHGETSSFLPDEETRKILNQHLSKKGSCFVSMGSDQVDVLHNLVFGRDFDHFIHIDHDMSRMRSLLGQLQQDTRYILTDPDFIPLAPASVDSLFSYDFVKGLEADVQKALYESLTTVLDGKSVSVVLTEAGKPCALESRYKSDSLGKKAKGLFTPWKKVARPTILFSKVTVNDNSRANVISGKTSLGSQFS